jgi:hypothetical protein
MFMISSRSFLLFREKKRRKRRRNETCAFLHNECFWIQGIFLHSTPSSGRKNNEPGNSHVKIDYCSWCDPELLSADTTNWTCFYSLACATRFRRKIKTRKGKLRFCLSFMFVCGVQKLIWDRPCSQQFQRFVYYILTGGTNGGYMVITIT